MNKLSSIGFLIAILCCSCLYFNSKKGKDAKVIFARSTLLNNGLIIENGVNRGTRYQDAAGHHRNIRYIPIKVTNDTVVPIQLDLSFSTVYDYPTVIDDTTFNIIPLPEAWVAEGSEISPQMFDDLSQIIPKPTVSKILQPGEAFLFGIGSVYPLPAEVCGVLPNALFTTSDKGLYQNCPEATKSIDSITNSSQALWLKLDFCVNSDGPHCNLISCGRLTYLNN